MIFNLRAVACHLGVVGPPEWSWCQPLAAAEDVGQRITAEVVAVDLEGAESGSR
jgi:hypothetical protein